MALVLLYLLGLLGSSLGARILGIFPIPSISHQLPFQAVMKALAERGHEVTVISTNPLKTKHANYTDIDLSFTYEIWSPIVSDFQKEGENLTPYDMTRSVSETMPFMCHSQLSSNVLQDFIKSKPQFDLVLIETIMYPCLYGLVYTVGTPPVIGILSLGGMSHTYDTMGSPVNPAVNPDIFWPHDDHMTFWERTDNFLFWLWSKYYVDFVIASKSEEILRQYFGNEVPSVWESERNYSLIMLNNHWSMSYPMAVVPGIIELGSLQVQMENKPLPKNIKEFLDGATDGFIYFSLGSNVRSDRLPEHKRNEFLAAFAELPQRVLWKWEADSLPGQPDNVMLGKWLPQQDILAHPNIRLFMTQGGLQSLNEATHNTVPLVGIPFFGDQQYNVKKIVTAGVGVKLNFETVTKASILEALKTVLSNPSYQKNMRKLSAINKDQSETPLQRAVWWMEYVLRNNGARHLRSAALDLAWYQYLLLDVIAFLIITSSAAIFLSWFIIKTVFRCISKLISPSAKLKEN